jgi:peptide/nickel transport system substrate-binding protein
MTYHLASAPDLLDPAKCSNLRCQRVMWPLYEPLVNLSGDLKAVTPGLAESWDVGADGLTYTFHLRKGVKFHDGTPFNAAAAKINLERNFLPGSAHYTAVPPNVRERQLGGLIKDVAVLNEHTLTIVLKSPKVHLLFLAPMVSPGALDRYGARLGESPVGTGPFRFVRATADEIRLAAFADYWGGRPKLDEISFRIISRSDRTMDEFLAGRIDFLPEVEPVYLERLRTPRTTLVRIPTLSIYYLGFRVDRPPLDDVRVRQALARAIDVERMVLFNSRGMAVPAYGPIPPGGDAYDAGLKRSRYSPEGARRQLAEIGHAAGLKLSLVVNADWGFLAELAQAVKVDLAKVGVAVELVPKSGWKDLVAAVRQGTGDLFIYNWFSIFTDPEIFLAPNYESGSADNLTRYGNPVFDALLQQARVTGDPAARLELYRRAQRILVEDSPILPLFHEVRVSAYRTRLSGVELTVHSQPVDRFTRIDIRGE